MVKISNLPALSALANDDYLAIVDKSGNLTAKISREDLFKMLALPPGIVTSSNIDFTTGIWWEELGRATLSSNGDSISIPSISARKHLKILANIIPTAAVSLHIRFNNDSAANYSLRFIVPGGTSGTATSITSLNNYANATDKATPIYLEGDILNVANRIKTSKITSVGGTTVASAAPDFVEIFGKWANTTNQITRIELFNTDIGDFAAGSTFVILGHD